MKIYSDGASKGNPGLSTSLIYVDTKPPMIIRKEIGIATNNQAEYTAFLMALEKAKEYEEVEILVDSSLILGHMTKGWKVNENIALVNLAKTRLSEHPSATVTWVPRDKNKAGIILGESA